MDQEFNHAANDSPRSGSSKTGDARGMDAIIPAIVCDGNLVAMRL